MTPAAGSSVERAVPSRIAEQAPRVGAAFAVCILLLSGFVTACGSPGSPQLDSIQAQLSDVQRSLMLLQQDLATKEEVAGLESNIEGHTQRLLRTDADLKVELDRLATQVEQLRSELEATNLGINQLSQRLAGTQQELQQIRQRPAPFSGEGVGPGTTSPPTSVDPETLYRDARRDYQSGDYEMAIVGFRQYLENFPDTELADNALYWSAESLFSQRKFRQAIEQFTNIQRRYPSSERLASAILRKGYAYLELRDQDAGIRELRTVAQSFPTSDEAKLARQTLQNLGVGIQ